MNLPSESNRAKVEWTVSTGTVLKIVGILFILWFVYFIRDIIAILFVALILSAIIDPLADWFEVRRVPRAVAVLIVYVALLSIFGLVIGVLIPPLVQEIRDLASNFSAVWDRLVSGAILFKEYSVQSGFSKNIEAGLSSVQTALTRAVGGAFTTVVNVFGGVVSFVLILVITFYMVIQEDGLKKVFRALIPDRYQSFMLGTLSKVQRKITSWVKGQLVLSAAVGTLVYIGLSIIGVNYALVLGLFAALVELVPYAGPFLAAVVAVFFALAQSTTKAFFVVLMFVVIQQLENNILVPKVMQKAVGLNPIISILALVIGAKLAGIMGALFAIPVATALDVIIREILHGSEKS
ncbi:AI-2E family transporter [Candidatus Uhrbacteria bacterium]|nr:AI-2E family transporter [Candidatus Uhrbacteria bacterium]